MSKAAQRKAKKEKKGKKGGRAAAASNRDRTQDRDRPAPPAASRRPTLAF